MKLNLGCGQNKLAGYVNVDKEGDPDELVNLHLPAWPFADSSVEEVVANHVLEHIGPGPDEFITFMKELYRVCAPGALVKIAVPHPRHDHFLGDPTHVRAVTPLVLSLFSKANCERWREMGAANSPLALFHGVDFEMVEERIVLDEPYRTDFKEGRIDAVALDAALRKFNNVATEIKMTLRAVK